MSKYSRLFAIASLIYLFLSGCLGITMAYSPLLRGILRFSHVHTMLIGWISMMVFGLAYHVIPRFAGSSLISDFWQKWHFLCANIGLIGMIITPILQMTHPYYNSSWGILFFVCGGLQLVGILIFVGTMLKTLKAFPVCSRKTCSSGAKPCCNEKGCS